MSNARRDFLKFAGGSVLGLGVTPIPWKLLDDSAIWTQNWSWTPKTPRGEISYRKSACTLCSRGCPIQVRCAGTQPVGVSPEKGSTLCAFGLTAHQAAYHPARIRRNSVAEAEAVAAVKAAIRSGTTIAVVDPAPGRIASSMYRQFAVATPNAIYIAEPEPRTLRAFEKVNGLPYRSTGVDLLRLRTIIAVDAPVLEDWGTPGLLMRRRGDLRVIWAGTTEGITAELADEHVRYSAIGALLSSVERPALVIGGEQLPWQTHIELAAMNRELGALQFRREGEEGAPTPIPSVPDEAIGMLIVEGAGVPLASLRRKLSHDCTIVAVSAFQNEYTAEARFVIPGPAPLESPGDVATPFDSPVSTMRIVPPVTASSTTLSMPDFLSKVTGGQTYERAIDARIAALHKAGRGTAKGTKPDEFLASVKEGTPWTDDPLTMPRGRDCPAPPEAPAVQSGRRLLTPRPLLAGLGGIA